MRIQINSYMSKRIDAFANAAIQELGEPARAEFQKAADRVAEEWSAAIPDGRGGSESARMKDIVAKVTMPRSGGFFVRMGWLNGSPMAADGKQTWFIYHDTGYHAFGKTWVAGIGVYLSQRSRLMDELENAKDRIITKIERMKK